MRKLTELAINWVEQGYVPDTIIRAGIKRLLNDRLTEIHADNIEDVTALKNNFVESMRQSPIAMLPEKANEQHYEVPAHFYDLVLGVRGKYSCCFWDKNSSTLNQAEKSALELTSSHAQLKDGHKILELGCGWGSLTLWMAEHYPQSNITAVSNSHSQKNYIDAQAKELGLSNIEVITCDMNDFYTHEQFDRVVSVEMFEHMRNWGMLFSKVSTWLKNDGKFFMHVFANRQSAYAFEVKESSDWMSEYFFSGGMMPSDDLPLYFQQDLAVETSWAWDGKHYEKTSNAWLENMDNNKAEILTLFNETYGEDNAQVWWVRWRIFFMSCAELFGFEDGQQWHVMHYTFKKALK